MRLPCTRIGLVDLDSATGQMMLSVNLMQSHQEVKKLGERSKRGLKTKTLDKDSSGGLPAYGFRRSARFSDTITDVDGRPKRLGVRFVPDPDTAPTVVRIFQLYRDGVAKIAIARMLNSEKVPTRSKRTTWSDTTIAAMLSNEVYTGLRIWNKTSRKGEKLPSGKKAQLRNPESEWVRVEDWCDRVIDAELWTQVQERLKADALEHKQTGTGKVHRQYLLSGLIVCGDCGGKFVIGSHFQGVLRYRCGRRSSRGGDVVCVNKKNVPQAALEMKVREAMDGIYKNPMVLSGLVKKHNESVMDFNAVRLDSVRRLESQLAQANTAVANLVTAIEGGASLPSLIASLTKREAEVAELTEKVREAKSELQPYLMPMAPRLGEYMRGDASIFSGDFIHDRAILDRVLDKILVGVDGVIVLYFRSEMFGPVEYEIHNLAEDPRPLSERRADLHFKQSELTGSPKTVLDFGGGKLTVAINENPRTVSDPGASRLVGFFGQDPEETVSVPSGI